MDWSHALGKEEPLRNFLAKLGSRPDQWLYVSSESAAIELDTPCHPLVVDESELSPEEQDELDAYPETVGLRCFLCLTQLGDIAENLRQQRPNFSNHELLNAINFYWSRDAFIDLSE